MQTENDISPGVQIDQLVRRQDHDPYEIELLRAALGTFLGKGPFHIYEGSCPDSTQWNARDQECPACKILLRLGL